MGWEKERGWRSEGRARSSEGKRRMTGRARKKTTGKWECVEKRG